MSWRCVGRHRARTTSAVAIIALSTALWNAAAGDEIDWQRADARGNRIPDFSYCGYRASEDAIPSAAIRVVVTPVDGDDGVRIQAAIDFAGSLEANELGVRGAVLLLPGQYEVAGQLRIEASGVVLRGSGRGDSGTTIFATGQDRRTLIRVRGRELEPRGVVDAVSVSTPYVPVGALELQVENAGGFRAGDHVFVDRPSTEAWVKAIGMDAFGAGWRPGTRDLSWDRTITVIDGDTVRLDAPLTTAIDSRFGGGRIRKYAWPGRIEYVGIENLRLVSKSACSAPTSEAHSWVAVSMENVADAWVRQADFAGFTGGAVYLWETTKRITVEDCIATDPISEIGGARRRTFFTTGQQNLFQRCWSEDGIEDFVVGHCAAGPNAFVSCTARRAHGDSGTIGSWASGVLFDNVRIDGGRLRFENLWGLHRGAGWSAANCVMWQCSAAEIRCFNPPTASNRAFGVWGRFAGNGHWTERNGFVSPRSLFAAQLEKRRGAAAATRRGPGVEYPRGSTSPRLEEAEEMVRASSTAAPTVRDLIVAAAARRPIPTEPAGVPDIGDLQDSIPRTVESPQQVQRLAVTNGWLTVAGKLALGRVYRPRWWRGNMRPGERHKFGHAITRFVPGREGQGFTDELSEVADHLVANGYGGLEHHYGLWYDRRRDDHQRVRRRDGAVEPPFYEMPFARSGKGVAWDGLSRYDLTVFNHWYWPRLETFAELCGERGLVLLKQHYFQHHLLEAGAHWADFPWRSANNINDTGFPEPPPYAGDKRIFQAHLFYDSQNRARRDLHRGYIHKCLESFAGNSNVLHLTSAEFTGPLAFMEFWIDTIIEWENQTSQDVVVVLSATKDVQDAILADAARAASVSVVDIRYWWYEAGGKLYAPEGGKNLSPRQFHRLLRPGRSSFDQTVRAIREVRDRCPDKAVIANVGSFDPWAVLIAGGSLPAIPSLPDALRKAVPRMRPATGLCPGTGTYALASPGSDGLFYAANGAPVIVDLTAWTGSFEAWWIDPSTGRVAPAPALTGGKRVRLTPGRPGPVALWFTSK